MRKIDNFINRYPLSKTLRFSLVPIGKTEETFNAKQMLKEDAGIIRKQLQAEDMLAMLNVTNENYVDPRIHRKKIRNASEILNILSTI